MHIFIFLSIKKMQSLWPLWIVLNTKSTLFEKSSCLAMSLYLLLPRRRSQKVAHLSLETSFYASLPTGFHPENLQRISCLAACLAMSLSLRSQSQHKLHFACTDRARIFCPANWLANWPPTKLGSRGLGPVSYARRSVQRNVRNVQINAHFPEK